jgi:hypothetical protein
VFPSSESLGKELLTLEHTYTIKTTDASSFVEWARKAIAEGCVMFIGIGTCAKCP